MRHSKKILFGFVMSCLVVACKYEDVKYREVESLGDKTFLAEAPTGRLVKNEAASEEGVSAKSFEFSVCLKDNNRELPIKKADFGIHFPDESLLTDRSDDEGCIAWTETFKVKATDAPSTVILEREIESLGVHRGTEKVTIAFNPWLATEEDAKVVDPKTVKEETLTEQEFESGKIKPAR